MNDQDLNWLHRNHSELSQYNNQWIAVSDSRVVTASTSLETVLQELAELEIASPVFAFITFDTWQ